jgi:RNA polymerase-binding transcription factor DksA
LELELRSARARLERSVSEATADGAAPSVGGGLGVPAHAEGEVAVALHTRAMARHQALVDAITRLEAGTYGTCVSCHQPIPYARLAVMPEASRCVVCGSRP